MAFASTGVRPSRSPGAASGSPRARPGPAATPRRCEPSWMPASRQWSWPVLNITVHGGNREIGGNKILVETEDGGLFLDFGKSYATEELYFETPWNPPYHVPSLLSIGALPDIPGLYRTDPGPHRYAVVVSHPHLDHVGYAPMLSAG